MQSLDSYTIYGTIGLILFSPAFEKIKYFAGACVVFVCFVDLWGILFMMGLFWQKTALFLWDSIIFFAIIFVIGFIWRLIFNGARYLFTGKWRL